MTKINIKELDLKGDALAFKVAKNPLSLPVLKTIDISQACTKVLYVEALLQYSMYEGFSVVSLYATRNHSHGTPKTWAEFWVYSDKKIEGGEYGPDVLESLGIDKDLFFQIVLDCAPRSPA